MGLDEWMERKGVRRCGEDHREKPDTLTLSFIHYLTLPDLFQPSMSHRHSVNHG